MKETKTLATGNHITKERFWRIDDDTECRRETLNIKVEPDMLKQLIDTAVDVDAVISDVPRRPDYDFRMHNLIVSFKENSKISFKQFVEMADLCGVKVTIKLDNFNDDNPYDVGCPVVYSSADGELHTMKKEYEALSPEIYPEDDFLTIFIKKAIIEKGVSKGYFIERCSEEYEAHNLLSRLLNNHHMSTKTFEKFCRILNLQVDMFGGNTDFADEKYEISNSVDIHYDQKLGANDKGSWRI